MNGERPPQLAASFMRPRPDTSSVVALLTKRRLAKLGGHLLADLGDFGAHLEHDTLDAASDRKITARRAPRRQARQCGQRDASDAVDQFIDIHPEHQFALLL